MLTPKCGRNILVRSKDFSPYFQIMRAEALTTNIMSYPNLYRNLALDI